MAQGKTRKPVKFGTCCSQVMALFLDIHTPKYKDKRQVIWDMAEAMNKELLLLRDAGCRCIQVEEPTFHFMANTYGKDHEEVKFMIDAFNREVKGLDDVELWIHTCWGNPKIAFYKASALAQGCNIARRELGFPTTYVPAADPKLQIDVVPGR